VTDRSGDARSGFTRAALLTLGVTAVVAVVLDQWVKYLSTEHLHENDPVRILGGLIYLSLLRNSGAAFSFGSGHTWVFPVITVLVIGWIGWMARRLRSVPWAVALGLSSAGRWATSPTGSSARPDHSRATWST